MNLTRRSLALLALIGLLGAVSSAFPGSGFRPAVDSYEGTPARTEPAGRTLPAEQGSNGRLSTTESSIIHTIDHPLRIGENSSTISNRFFVKDSFFTIRTLEADETGGTFEVRINNFQHTKETVDGTVLDVLRLPGAGGVNEPGHPRLPMIGILYGIPQGGDIQVSVVKTEDEYLEGYTILPVETREVYYTPGGEAEVRISYPAREDIYGSPALYPAQIAERGFSAIVRGLEVVQLRIFPFRYNPVAGRLTFHKRMIVRVDIVWPEPSVRRGRGLARREPAEPLDPRYEEILRRAVINFRDAGAWTRTLDGGTEEDRSLRGFPPASFYDSYKVEVHSTGIYRIDYAGLMSVGFPVDDVDPRRLQMHCGGEQIPIVVIGQQDGSFDETDYIEFYGTPAATEFTRANVYWLFSGAEEGLRVQTAEAPWSGDLAAEEMFRDRMHAEVDLLYWRNLPEAKGHDHWFWQLLSESLRSWAYQLPLSNLATTAEECTLRVSLQGKTQDYDVDKDHHVMVYINNQVVGEDRWDGQVPHLLETVFPQSLLDQSDNILLVRRTGYTGAKVDQFYVDWLEIDCWKRYDAEEGALGFQAEGEGRQAFAIEGFSSPDVHLYDVTDPIRPVRLLGFQAVEQGGSYTVRFEADIAGTRSLMAVEQSSMLEPKAIVRDQPSSLRSPANGADCIAIAHGDLIGDLGPLVEMWRSKGLRTHVADVQDLYDEFSFGLLDPAAIRDFLSYAYFEWERPAPVYVLLVGDGTYDYRDNLERGDFPHVPTHLFESIYGGQTATDNWFVCVEGEDQLPEMFIGRLTARTEDDLQAFVTKALAYEGVRQSNVWNARALFVADDGYTYEDAGDYLASLLPEGYEVLRVYQGQYPAVDDARADLINHLGNGCLMCNYTGHGNIDNWTGEGLLLSSHIDQFPENDKLPLGIALSCLNGYFFDPVNIYSIGEEFVRAERKGAIAFWSSTWVTYLDDDVIIASRFINETFRNDMRILGQSTTYGKIWRAANTYSLGQLYELVNTMILLGDPTTELALPTPMPPAGVTAVGRGSAVNLVWEPNSETDVTGYNLYRQDPTAPEFSKINISPVERAFYRDEAVLNDSTYTYYATAIDDAGFESNPSAHATGTPKDYPSDGMPPVVEIEMDGRPVSVARSVSPNPVITVTFADTDGIDCYSLELLVDGDDIPQGQVEFDCPKHEEFVFNGHMRYESQLGRGLHRIKTRVRELSGLMTELEHEFEVRVDLDIKWAAVFPNPLSDEAQFSYELTGPAQVKIKIFTVSGRLVRSISTELDDSCIGVVQWDGRDEGGKRLANGTYLYKMTASDGRKTAHQIGKLAVLR